MSKTKVNKKTISKAAAIPVAFLQAHMEKKSLTAEAVSNTLNLRPSTIEDALKDVAFLAFDTLWLRASRYTNFELPASTTRVRAVTLQSFIDNTFRGDASAFAADKGENLKFVEDAIASGALWLRGEIFRPAEITGLWQATRLDVHIDRVIDGNTTAFAKAYNVLQQQMHRWVHRDCFFCNGEIYMRRTELKTKEGDPLPATTTAILLSDHINTVYGEGDDGIKLFARKYDINLQQVKRFLKYKSLWILGDVYKNQSDFAERGIKPQF
jgi:hypothetical protein